jgi:hypothetical protein
MHPAQKRVHILRVPYMSIRGMFDCVVCRPAA